MFRQLNAVLVLMTTSSSPFSSVALYVATGTWQTATKEFYRMKKSLVCALLAMTLACCGTALYAQQDNMGQGGQQQRGHMPMSAEQRLEHMTKMLNLTSDQQQKIKPILENEQSQMTALHEDTTTPQADRMAKAREIRQNSQQQINGILTPEQQQKWQSMQGRREGGMGHGGMGQGQPQQAPQQ